MLINFNIYKLNLELIYTKSKYLNYPILKKLSSKLSEFNLFQILKKNTLF